MKIFRRLLFAGALVLFAAGSAGAAPDLSFLTADPATGPQKASTIKPGAVTNAWMTCSFTCQDSSTQLASCNASIETCCQAGDRLSCRFHGGLLGGTCNDNGTILYCS